MSTVSRRSSRTSPTERSAEIRNWVIVIGVLLFGSGSGLATYLHGGGTPKPEETPRSVSTPAPGINVTVNGNLNGSSLLSGVQVAGGDVRGSSAAPSQQIVAPHTEGSAALPPRAQPKPPTYERYIDRGVHRVAGTLNVALALQGGSGNASAALQGAVRRALMDKGMSIVPLFREAFLHEGLARRMFDGDASLARDLKLREYVDSVLVAELRFSGPAQMVSGGMYIREAVLEVHAIDPSSGEVRKVLEIRDKGGGPDEEQSSVNAIDRLEEQVEAQLGEWSWV